MAFLKKSSSEFSSAWYAERFHDCIKHSGHLFPHHTFSMLNAVSDCSCPPESFQTPRWFSTHPLPKVKTTLLAKPHDDPVLRLVQQKDDHIQELDTIKHNFNLYNKKKRTAKKISFHANLAKEGTVGLQYVQMFAEKNERNPDAYFSGKYNWYFTGSNSIVMNLPTNDLLIHATGAQLNELAMHTINISDGDLSLIKTDSFIDCDEAFDADGFIYELGQNYDAQQLSVRQKLKISTFNVNRRQVASVFKSDVPFVSSTFKKNSSHFVTVDANRTVKIWDESTCIHETCLRHTKHIHNDNWSCVRGFQGDAITYTDRQRVTLFDTRQPLLPSGCLAVLDLEQQMENCEQITIIEPSSHNANTIYVGMTHQLYAIDVRNISEKQYTMLQWRHQMQSNPTMLCSLNARCNGNNEMVVISGSVPGETRIFESSRNADNIVSSPYLPYRPLSLNDTHDKARKQGVCLEPMSAVPQQIKMCTTGIALYDSLGPTMHLLFQNSAGDMFAQTLFSRDSVSQQDDSTVRKLLEWDEQLTELSAQEPVSSFDIFSLTNYSTMAKTMAYNLRNPHGVGGSGMVDTRLAEEPHTIRSTRWKNSYKKLSSYTDALAADMLAVWQLDPVNTDIAAPSLVASSERISKWLQSTGAPNSTPTKNDSLLLSEYQIEDTLNEPIEGVTEETPEMYSSFLNTSAGKSKTKRQPRTFVPGF